MQQNTSLRLIAANLSSLVMHFGFPPPVPVAVTTFKGQVVRQWNRWGGKRDKSPPVTDFFAAPPAD